MPIKVRVGQTEAVKILSSKGGGSVSTQDAVNVIGGIASVSQLSVSGLSTFTGIGTFVDDLYVGDKLYVGDDLTVTNDINLGDNLFITQSGGIQNQGFTNLYGDTVIGGVNDSLSIIAPTLISANLNATGITTISNLYGDGSNLTGVSIAGIDTAGTSNLNQLNVAGVSTFNDHVNIANDKQFNIGNNKLSTQYQSTFDIIYTNNNASQYILASDGITLQNVAGQKYIKATSTNTGLYHVGTQKLRTSTEGIEVVNNASGVLGTMTALNVDTTFLKASGVSTFVGDAQFDGNVSIGGTLTYEDVTNIDSIGIITARKDVHVGAGLSVVGFSTFSNDAQFMDMVRLGRPHSAEESYTPGKFFIYNGKDPSSGLDGNINFQDHLYIHGPIQVRIGPVGEYLRIYNYNGRGAIQFGNNSSTKTGLDMFGKGSVSMRVDTKEGVGIGSTAADVTLGYDGNPKFQTSGVGATVYGQLDTTDLNVNGTLTAGIIDGGSF